MSKTTDLVIATSFDQPTSFRNLLKELQAPKRLWVCTDHAGHYPAGVASLVMAHSEHQAINLLRTELKKAGLDADKPFTLTELDISLPFAYILRDGDY